jgi:acetoin utilization deacetylase AcuC-like enzyme
MKIIHAPHIHLALEPFGFTRPLYKDRYQQILDSLSLSHQKFVYQFSMSPPLAWEDLAGVHHPDYLNAFFSDTENSARHVLTSAYDIFTPREPVGTTYRAGMKTLRQHVASVLQASSEAVKQAETLFFLGGGMHHAYSKGGGGFCVANDIMAAAYQVLKRDPSAHVCILDVDAHFGDGIADILHLWKKEASPFLQRLYSIDLHLTQTWPFIHQHPLEKNRYSRHLRHHFDGPIPPANPSFKQGAFYLNTLARAFSAAKMWLSEHKQKRFQHLIILLGADSWENDELPSASGLRLTLDDLKMRDQMILHFLHEKSESALITMSGGYGAQAALPYVQFIQQWI